MIMICTFVSIYTTYIILCSCMFNGRAQRAAAHDNRDRGKIISKYKLASDNALFLLPMFPYVSVAASILLRREYDFFDVLSKSNVLSNVIPSYVLSTV